MTRKLAKPGFVTVTEFARRIGVSQPAVTQAIQSGRLRAYYDDRGRKWLKPAEVARDWDAGRLRFDDFALLAPRLRRLDDAD
jgi:excisionase family DNA binding protein